MKSLICCFVIAPLDFTAGMESTSQQTIENINGIPIVVVYNANETYATQNGVNYDKLTYELLLEEDKESQLKVEKSTPNGPEGRLHKISHLFDAVDARSYAVNRCDTKYQNKKNECGAKNAPILFGTTNEEYEQCMDDASSAYRSCIESTPDYKECMDNATEENEYCLTYTDGTQYCQPIYNPNQLGDQCYYAVGDLHE